MQQSLDNGTSSIRILVNMRTLRVARRLVDAGEDSSVQVATPATLSANERAKYLEDNGFGNDAFKAWCDKNELCMGKVAKYQDKSKCKHPKLSFAKDAFIYLHQNFYFYDSSRSWVPVKPVDVIKGDRKCLAMITLVCCYFKVQRIVSRCLSGAWLWSNDGPYTAQGINVGHRRGNACTD